MKEKIINAEQINIVGKDGTPRLTLFNEDHIPNPLFKGEEILKGHRQNDNIAGMLFFNPDGTECGGLIYGNNEKPDGTVTAGVSLTLDQFEQDQVLQLLYTKDGNQHEYGINLFDRPTTISVKEQVEMVEDALLLEREEERAKKIDAAYEGAVQRAFIGKQNEEITINLFDTKRRPRVRVFIDANDEPQMNFYDAEGNITYSLPPKK